MASDNEASCENDPNFAVICGFLEKFGTACGITNIDFVELKDMLENTQEVSPELIELHIKLLRKARKSVSNERWERAIIKLCHGFCSQDAWEIERFGYKKARLTSKLKILKELLEMQFDYNVKFKTEINKMSADELRSKPLGRDRMGHTYWMQCDESCQIRVYKEDPDEETWVLVAKDRDGLLSLINQLKNNDTFKLGIEPVLNEDSNSLELEKPITDTGQSDSKSTSPKLSKQNSEEDSETTGDSIKDVQENGVTKEENGLTNEENETATQEPKKEIEDETKVGEEPRVEEANKQEVETKVDKEEVKTEDLPPRPTLRIKPISELMSHTVEPVGIKEKYIRSEKTIHGMALHRKAVDSAQFDAAEFKTSLKRDAEDDPDEEVREVKRTRSRPTLLSNKKKPYGDEIVEPIMVIRGEGSGYDNQASPVVGDAIEEPVLYFFGVGNGRDCQTGNDRDKDTETSEEKSDTNSINCKCSAAADKCACSSTVLKTPFKLGTIIDTKLDLKCTPKSPTKKSRWDVGKPVDGVSDINSVNCKGNSDESSSTQPEQTVTQPKPMFFFGPGCMQFKSTASTTLTPSFGSVKTNSEHCQKNDNIKEEEISMDTKTKPAETVTSSGVKSASEESKVKNCVLSNSEQQNELRQEIKDSVIDNATSKSAECLTHSVSDKEACRIDEATKEVKDDSHVVEKAQEDDSFANTDKKLEQSDRAAPKSTPLVSKESTGVDEELLNIDQEAEHTKEVNEERNILGVEEVLNDKDLRKNVNTVPNNSCKLIELPSASIDLATVKESAKENEVQSVDLNGSKGIGVSDQASVKTGVKEQISSAIPEESPKVEESGKITLEVDESLTNKSKDDINRAAEKETEAEASPKAETDTPLSTDGIGDNKQEKQLLPHEDVLSSQQNKAKLQQIDTGTQISADNSDGCALSDSKIHQKLGKSVKDLIEKNSVPLNIEPPEGSNTPKIDILKGKEPPIVDNSKQKKESSGVEVKDTSKVGILKGTPDVAIKVAPPVAISIESKDDSVKVTPKLDVSSENKETPHDAVKVPPSRVTSTETKESSNITVKVSKEIKITTDAPVKEKTTLDISKENKETLDIAIKLSPRFDISTENKETLNIAAKVAPLPSTSKENIEPLDTAVKVSKESKGTTDTPVKEKATFDISKEKKETVDAAAKAPPLLDVSKESKEPLNTAVKLSKENKGSTDTTVKDKTFLGISKENKETSCDAVKETATTSSPKESKATSDVAEKGVPKASKESKTTCDIDVKESLTIGTSKESKEIAKPSKEKNAFDVIIQEIPKPLKESKESFDVGLKIVKENKATSEVTVKEKSTLDISKEKEVAGVAVKEIATVGTSRESEESSDMTVKTGPRHDTTKKKEETSDVTVTKTPEVSKGNEETCEVGLKVLKENKGPFDVTIKETPTLDTSKENKVAVKETTTVDPSKKSKDASDVAVKIACAHEIPKEKKETSDLEVKEMCTPLSKEKDSCDIAAKGIPTICTSKENKEVSDAGVKISKENKGISDVTVKETPTLSKESKGTLNVAVKIAPRGSIVKESSDILLKGKPIDTSQLNKQTSDFTVKVTSISHISREEKATSGVAVNALPDTSKENKETSKVTVARCDISKEKKESLDIVVKETLTTDISKERKETSYVAVKPDPSCDMSKENKGTFDAAIKEKSTPDTSKENNEASVVAVKEMSTPDTSKQIEETSAVAVKVATGHGISKEKKHSSDVAVKEMPTPDTSKEIEEASKVTVKVAAEDGIPKEKKDISDVAVKEMPTPDTSKEIEEASAVTVKVAAKGGISKEKKDILDVAVKEMPTAETSKEIEETSAAAVKIATGRGISKEKIEVSDVAIEETPTPVSSDKNEKTSVIADKKEISDSAIKETSMPVTSNEKEETSVDPVKVVTRRSLLRDKKEASDVSLTATKKTPVLDISKEHKLATRRGISREKKDISNVVVKESSDTSKGNKETSNAVKMSKANKETSNFAVNSSPSFMKDNKTSPIVLLENIDLTIRKEIDGPKSEDVSNTIRTRASKIKERVGVKVKATENIQDSEPPKKLKYEKKEVTSVKAAKDSNHEDTRRVLRSKQSVQTLSEKPDEKVKSKPVKAKFNAVKRDSNTESDGIKQNEPDTKDEEVLSEVEKVLLPQIETVESESDKEPMTKVRKKRTLKTFDLPTRTTRSRSSKPESEKEDLQPVKEPKCIKKHVPLLYPEAKDPNSPKDPETDPLALTEEDIQATKAPMTLSTFSLDVGDPVPSVPVKPLMKLRKRGHNDIETVADVEVVEKKQKLRGKRTIDTELRKSIEEQKKKEMSTSDDDNTTKNDIVTEENETKPIVKRGRKKKKRRGRWAHLKENNGNSTPGSDETVDTPPLKENNENSTPASDVTAGTPSLKENNENSNLVSDEAVDTPPSKVEGEAAAPTEKKKKKRSKRRTILGLELPEDPTALQEDVSGVRHSRRIAQIKIKEEAERRKIEEMTLTDIKEKKKKSKKGEDKDYKVEVKKKHKQVTEDESTQDGEIEEKKKRKRKRKHTNPHKLFDESNPWKSSSGSSSSNEEEEEEEEDIAGYSEEEAPLFKSDHEFSPESDLEDSAEAQPLKRARTARKESDVEEEVDDCACQKCGKTDHPEWILLCDSCDNGWHCSCLRPPLLVIPEGDWYCPPCQHDTLITNLHTSLAEYDKKLSKKDIETRRKERLAYVGISLNNVLPAKQPSDSKHKHARESDDESQSADSDSESDSGSTSSSDDEPIYQLRERRQAHSYRFNDYDDLINSAIQDEMEAVKGAGNQGRGKDISTIVNAEKEEEAEKAKTEAIEPEPLPPVVPRDTDIPQANDNEESEEEVIRPVKKKLVGRKKTRKLNSLDISSEDDPYSDEDFKGTSSSDDDEDFDEVSESSDNSRSGRRGGGPVRRSTRARISRYDREFINDDSDDDDFPRRKKRSIWDESEESEDSDRSWGRRKRKAARSSRRRSPKPKKVKKKNKKKKTLDESDSEFYKNKKKPKIKYGRIGSDNEDTGVRRTRGKKINFLEVLGTDSDEEITKKSRPRAIESEEEYVVNEDDEREQEQEDLDNEKNSEDEEEEQSESDEDGTPVKVPKVKVLPVVNPHKEIPTDPVSAQETPEMQKLVELNPIEEINRSIEQMNEKEMEKMMEEEEYANKQLQLVALQIEKEKRRREREAQMLLSQQDGSLGKKAKFPVTSDLLGADPQENAELSEPPGISLPMFAELPPVQLEGESRHKKRKARANNLSTSPSSPMQGSKLGIATPPQPFSQSQPAPSVITRMLQSQPGHPAYPVGTSGAYYPGDQQGPPPVDVALSNSQGNAGQFAQGPPRVQVPNQYRHQSVPPNVNQYPPRGPTSAPQQRSQVAPPHIYHSHRSMDPSPSGGGQINVPPDQGPPAAVPPPTGSPINGNKGENFPRQQQQQQMRYPPPPNPMMSPHLQPARVNSMSPYHPTMPSNYYGAYQPMANEEVLGNPPSYQAQQPYQEQFSGDSQGAEASGKGFEDESGGEFGGLVSYFSSQREDDLDT